MGFGWLVFDQVWASMNWVYLPISWPGITSIVIAAAVYFSIRRIDVPPFAREAALRYATIALAGSLLILVPIGWVQTAQAELSFHRCRHGEPLDSWLERGEEMWLYPCLRDEHRWLNSSRLYLSPGNARYAERRLPELRELMNPRSEVHSSHARVDRETALAHGSQTSTPPCWEQVPCRFWEKL